MSYMRDRPRPSPPREGDFGYRIDYLPRIRRRKANRLG